MSDIADQAQEYEEVALTVARINHNYRPVRQLERTGRCYYCGEPVTEDKLFCDADCSDDYHWEQKGRSGN